MRVTLQAVSRERPLSYSLPVTGNTEQTQPENRAFYPALDGLRAVAFLMVFFMHYMTIPWGWAGVNIFFVLSGFLITGILFDTREDTHRIRNFYVRRILRIFPLYYGVLIGIAFLYPYAHWQVGWGWLVWPAFVGSFAGFFHPYFVGGLQERLVNFVIYAGHATSYAPLYLGHFWSLCVEEQFYVVWPAVVYCVRDRRKLLWICAASVPLCLAARILCSYTLPEWLIGQHFIDHATPLRVDDLLLGGLLALMLRGPYVDRLLRWARIATPMAFAALLIWAMLTPAHMIFAHPYPYPTGALTWGFTVIAVLTALVILCAIQPGTLIYRALRLYPLRWMGRISYGAYVLHDIPHVLYGHITYHLAVLIIPGTNAFGHLLLLQMNLLVAFFALISTYALAWLSFRFYESPFLNLKERWTIRGTNSLREADPANVG